MTLKYIESDIKR